MMQLLRLWCLSPIESASRVTGVATKIGNSQSESSEVLLGPQIEVKRNGSFQKEKPLTKTELYYLVIKTPKTKR